MANNRMKFVCAICFPADGAAFHLGKYYPSQGWYVNRSGDIGAQLDEWFEKHRHGTVTGDEIVLVRDSDDTEHPTQRVLKAIHSPM